MDTAARQLAPARPRPGRATLGRLFATAALVAGSLCVPGAAQAKPAVLATSCQPTGVTSSDRAIAERLRPSMTGRRLGRSVSGASIACARAIVAIVQQRGLGRRAAVIAVTTAIAESTLHNHAVAVDHDSLGLFQQRPSQGWGAPARLVDPAYATRAFLSSMIRKFPDGGWRGGDIGAICQRVQNSAHPLAYAPEVGDAERIVAAVWARPVQPVQPAPAAVPARPAPRPAAPAPAPPTGPFQRTLAVLQTELGRTDGHHEVLLADWNADRRPDLVAVHGTGTATGRTEVRIMDGTAQFAMLRLHTVTALGATDARHAYALADVNADRRPDLFVVQRSGAAGGHTELRILDGMSSFQRPLLTTALPVPATDERHTFAVADVDADGRPDLVVVQRSGTAGGKVEVRVLAGATDFQQELTRAVTAAGPADERHEVFVADHNGDRRPDLVVVQKSGAAGGRVEVRVLDGAAGFARVLAQAVTPLGPLDARHDLAVADWNADGRPDLLVTQKQGTASGRVETTVLGG